MPTESTTVINRDELGDPLSDRIPAQNEKNLDINASTKGLVLYYETNAKYQPNVSTVKTGTATMGILITICCMIVFTGIILVNHASHPMLTQSERITDNMTQAPAPGNVDIFIGPSESAASRWAAEWLAAAYRKYATNKRYACVETHDQGTIRIQVNGGGDDVSRRMLSERGIHRLTFVPQADTRRFTVFIPVVTTPSWSVTSTTTWAEANEISKKLYPWLASDCPPVRSYVFCPYTMVKDYRTGLETDDVQSFGEGYIEPFLESWASQVDAIREHLQVNLGDANEGA